MKVNRNGTITRIVVTLSVLIGAVAVPQPTAAQAQTLAQNPVSILAQNNPDVIPGEYIVVMKEGVSDASLNATIASVEPTGFQRLGAEPFTRFSNAITGFAGKLSPSELEELAADPNVAFIEADAIVRSFSSHSNLDRIDQRGGRLDGVPYRPEFTGRGVHAYVIDSGIRPTQREFTGRIGNGFSRFGDSTDDCNGHGTHVAATLGGRTLGVAPEVTIHPVKVLNCDGLGTTSGIVAGIDWVTANRVLPAVANLSLGGFPSPAQDAAVNRLIDSGVTVVVAAGNNGADACSVSPARVPRALTVGASAQVDARASFSNIGPCIDIFAPGLRVISADYQSDTGTTTLSGTSMAAPHVAGAVAQYLEEDPSRPPGYIDSIINASATSGVLSDVGDSRNLLLSVLSKYESLDCQNSTGSISGTTRNTGSSVPSERFRGAQFYSVNAESLRACLYVPSGAQLTLSLQKYNLNKQSPTDQSWTTVFVRRTSRISPLAPPAAVFVEYAGAARSVYRWTVTSDNSATESYLFDMDQYASSRPLIEGIR